MCGQSQRPVSRQMDCARHAISEHYDDFYIQNHDNTIQFNLEKFARSETETEVIGIQSA